jgi:hypothetical protein
MIEVNKDQLWQDIEKSNVKEKFEIISKGESWVVMSQLT